MKKKKVPDWLNSSLWSSPHPPPPPPPPPFFSSATVDLPIEQHTSAISSAAPSQPPSPPATVDDPPEPQRIQDSRPKNHTHTSTDATFSSSPSADDISRQAELSAELSKKVIDMRELRRLACQGLPDGAGIRSTVWKSEITRRMYNSTSSDADDAKVESRTLLSRSEITHGEHPLSLGETSVWNQFFQDTEIIDQIDRDVKRTHPDMHFFCSESQFAKSNQEALKNILIIFAKLNPGVRYVQGMNELLAPLYYVFKNDPDEENAAFAEADSFFCFVELLSGFRDNFVKQLDNSVVGIRSTITRLSQLLKEHDEELWRHLEITCKVNPQFYAFRWITLLLTQEFNFADSLHIWDTLLSDPEGPQETLMRICCAMLILVRKRLLAGDFTSNLKLLQNYPSTNISHLLYVANKFRV
ncbi:uncharacterized protein [Arachis hypogaea]|uniref:uncharacterized protein isoform X4 n=1 Tax=Arachis hypogaea TaxID=3818 RepID=UPI003B21B4E0